MKAIWLILVFLSAILFISPAAHAACTINDNNGIKFLDSDCDGVVDNNIDGVTVDICPLARNGNCDADPINCDVNNNGITTKLETIAGDQSDWNHNGIGDACEDADSDGVLDYLDNCVSKPNPGQGANDCVDSDGDKIDDESDNCPKNYNTGQIDTDEDHFGDACDTCALDPNPDQDNEICKNSSGSAGVNRDIANPDSNTTPGQGINYITSDRESGSGGCSLGSVNVSPMPFAALGAFLISVMVTFRRRF